MRYDAFISYRHAELDMEIAKKVHAGLESFKVPPSVQKRATKKRIRRVFRDQEELPIGSDLGENIATALYNSDFLVVICSPRTMGSEWVMKEIDTFISMHGREHILAVLIEGEPEQSFPPQLRIDDMGRAVEPLAADVRGANRRERNEKLKSELIRLAAPILGCNYDDLRQRHRERKLRKTMGIVAAVTGGIAVAAAAFGVYSTIVANQMKNLADEKSRLAEKMTVIASQKSEYADQVQYNMDQKNQNQSRYLVAMADTLFRNGNREDAVLVTLEALPAPGSLASDYYDEDEDDDDDWDDEEDDDDEDDDDDDDDDDDEDDEIDESDAHFNDTRLYIPEAEYALSNFLYAYSCGNELGVDRSMSHDMPVLMMEARRDGQYVVTVDSVGATYLWESAYGTNLLKIDADMNTDGSRIVPLAVALDDEFIYIVVDRTIKKYDYYGGLVYQRDIDINMAAKSARIYPEESYAFVVSDFGMAIIDIATGESALYYSESDIRFDGYMDYSEDSHYFVASHSERFGDTVELTVINTDNLSTVNTYVYEGQQVKLVDVQSDGKAVFMIDLDCDAEITGSIKTRLMCVDCRDGSEVWRNEAVYAYNVGKSRITSIDNAVSFSGINRKVVTVAVGRNLTTYKFDTGEMMSTGILQDEIVDIWSSNVQGYIVAVQSNGRVDIVRCETGAVYEPGTVELDVPVSGWWSGGGLCLVQNEKDVVIMRYHTASDLETIISDAGANFAKLSTAEDYIVNYGYTGDFSFYRTDGEFIRTIVINGARTERFSSFTFDNYFVTLSIEDNQPVCNWYEPIRDDLHKYTLFGNVSDVDKTVREVIYNRSHTYAVYVCDYCYSVVDLTNRVEVYSGTTDEIITGAAVSENGAYLYLAFADAPFCDINLSTLDITRYPELALNCGSIGNNNIIVSDDGWYVAVCCKDAFIRTADLFEEYVTTELEIFSTDNFSMVFMPMLKDVLVCYNSEDVCVIDAEYGYISEHISMELEGVESLKYDEELHYYAVVLENGVTLMDELTNKPVAFVPNAFGYISSTHTFLVKNNSDIYTTKYKNYEELIEEAHRQFPDAELTEEEMIKYNII